MMDHEESVIAKSLGAVMDICKRWRETAKVGLSALWSRVRVVLGVSVSSSVPGAPENWGPL